MYANLVSTFQYAILQADIRGMIDAWVMNQFLLQKSKCHESISITKIKNGWYWWAMQVNHQYKYKN